MKSFTMFLHFNAVFVVLIALFLMNCVTALNSESEASFQAEMNLDEVINDSDGDDDQPIDSTVAVIIARELIEMTMFIVSHVGAVVKHPTLSRSEKFAYLRYLIPSIFIGILCAGSISIAVGFSLAAAFGQIGSARIGVEAGEGSSKCIAFVFISSLTLKVPIWFGISNFHPKEEHHHHRVVIPTTVDEENGESGPNKAMIGSKWAMAISLFWNTMREGTEAGVYTGIAVLLNENSRHKLGQSVGVGIAAVIVLGSTMSLGAKYISAKGFGVAATLLTGLLAVGLITGVAGSFEEVYDLSHGGETPELWDVEGHAGDTMQAFSFLGLSPEWTVLQLVVWIVAAITLTSASIWQNYYGYPLFPKAVEDWMEEKKKGLSEYLGFDEKDTSKESGDVGVYNDRANHEERGSDDASHDVELVDTEQELVDGSFESGV